jgi:1,4-alpha-glucan branching enzyme
MAHYPAVKSFIDVFYAPIGFSIIEEVYCPPSQRQALPYTDVRCLADHLNQSFQSDRREAYYAQLHDETWYCQHISTGRPLVPWAYGGRPAQLAKNKGEELIQMGLLTPMKLLDYVRRTVRNAEALTMFSATLRYMFVPEVDSLGLGALDHPELWKVQWDGVTPKQMIEWQQTGLTDRDILWYHSRHRQDMIKLRQIFRTYSKVDEQSYQPLVQPQVYYYDQDSSILSLFRSSLADRHESLLVIFNFGNEDFNQDRPYELPTPEEFMGTWEVLFDGDRTYAAGTILHTGEATFSNRPNSLKLQIYGFSLLVLRYAGQEST